MKIRNLILGFVLTAHAISAEAQQAVDTISRKNTVKLDMTSRWLYKNAFVISYERIVKTNQTWAVSAGFQQLHGLKDRLDSINITRDKKATGYKVGGEYRFYLKKENKFNAPRGVYMGPYMSILNFSNQRLLEFDNNGVLETGMLKSKINIINIGFQLGYQFLVNDRWTFDLVFVGPSLSNYRAAAKLEGSITLDPDEISDEISKALLERFPLIKDIIAGNTVSSSGKINTWSYGFRYQFQVGYHFGKKKK